MPPEQLYSEATHCFDALIDISHNTDAVKNFASRRQTDLKYLVDGANFVISQMHFNPEGNHYITLGIPQDSTPEEIKERWKRLMLLYHPDRQAGQEEWVSERAKKVNEAYNTLKDESRRTSYNKKLLDEKVIARAASHPRTPKKRAPLRNAGIQAASPSWERTRRYFPKILVGLYLLVALSVIGFIYYQNRSTHLETALRPQEAGVLQKAMPSAEEKTDVPITPSAPEGDNRGRTQGIHLYPSTVNLPAADAKQLNTSLPQPEKLNKRTAAPPQEAVQADKPEATTRQEPLYSRNEIKTNIRKQISTPIPFQQPEELSSIKENIAARTVQPAAKENTKSPEPLSAPLLDIDDKPKNPEKTVPTLQTAAPPPPLSPAKSDAITKDEIDDFIRRYINAYERNDLNAIMLLFSRSAVENNTLDYNAIRNAYRQTFSEKINYYKLTNLMIKIDGSAANVNGNYSINRYNAPDNKWISYRGRIHWLIARENDSLKIIRLNYDN